MKLWGGRFTKSTDQLALEFQASISFDQKLVREDIIGSIVHVEMLGKQGILTEEETDTIKQGLAILLERAEAGELAFSVEHEDIHMNIEKMLIELIGPLGGKLHTGRSRNDQSALDVHLYARKMTAELVANTIALSDALLAQAEQHIDTLLPGYTHLQRAQPVRFAHHLLAYVSMFERDLGRLMDSYQRTDMCPLGAGAIAGTTFPIDRKYVRDRLKFTKLYENSMDAVSDRDYIVELTSACSLLMVHLSRLAEELILWSSEEFQYVELDDAYCTGSSMMPQKKNPDIPELVRGKTGRVFGNLTGLLTMLKALPLSFNKDMQEDKEALFDTVETTGDCLQLMAAVVETMVVKKENMLQNIQQSYANATDLADYLAAKGVPFREAHEITGKTVLYAISQQKYLLQLSLDEYQQFSPIVSNDIYTYLAEQHVVEARKSEGGTAKQQVLSQLKQRKIYLNQARQWLQTAYETQELSIKVNGVSCQR
jgi:argininosuccinate lyase